MLLKQSTVRNLMFKMIDSADHLSKKTGLTCVVNISKNGGAFAAAGGAVTEIANGWYQCALTTTDTNTLGDLAFYITATGADDTDFVRQVVVDLPGATTAATAIADAVLTRATSNVEAAVKAAPKCLGALVIMATHQSKDDGAGNFKWEDSAGSYAGANAIARPIVSTDTALAPVKELGALA